MPATQGSSIVSQGQLQINEKCPRPHSEIHRQCSPLQPCIFCKEEGHCNYQCPAFKALDVESRRQWANSLQVCYNCLSTRHRSRDCTSNGRCRECNGQHHTHLHIITQSQASTPTTNVPSAAVNLAFADQLSRPSKSVLRTAVVQVDSGFGSRTATLMFHEGAEVSLITSSLARTINANFKPYSLRIDGVGPSVISCRHTVDIALHLICLKQSSTSTNPSLSYPSSVSVHCYVVDKPFHVNTSLDSAAICYLMADRTLEPLADPAPAKVELLLCAGDSHRCYTGPEFYFGDRSQKFVRTLFEWTLGGTVHSQASRSIVSKTSQ